MKKIKLSFKSKKAGAQKGAALVEYGIVVGLVSASTLRMPLLKAQTL